MGSYCALRFDERDVLSFKSSVPEALISLFQETDRRETIDKSDPDEDRRIVTYWPLPPVGTVRRSRCHGARGG
jgi:hypothetical protein